MATVLSKTAANLIGVLLIALAARAAIAAEPGVKDPNADWPCIQHKVTKLTSAQMWDGPVVDDVTEWSDNEEIGKLVATLASRRLPMEQAEAAIDTFAAAQPQDKR